MKILVIAAALAGSVAMAQEVSPVTPSTAPVAPTVTETKTKITCSIDEKGTITDPTGNVERADRSGRFSESIRTSWKADGVEYRFSEYKSYEAGTDTVRSIGRASFKIIEKVEGNKLTETNEQNEVSYMVNGLTYKNGPFRQTNRKTETVTEVDGNIEKAIKITVDGKEQPTYGEVTTKVKLSDTLTVLTSTISNPFEEVFDGYKYNTERSQTTCILELLK